MMMKRKEKAIPKSTKAKQTKAKAAAHARQKGAREIL
jgi:hypothetical protein